MPQSYNYDIVLLIKIYITAPKHKKTIINFTQYSPTFPKLAIANLL